ANSDSSATNSTIGLAIVASGTAKNSTLLSFQAGAGSTGSAFVGIRFLNNAVHPTLGYGIDFNGAGFLAPIRLGNNHSLYWRNAADSQDYQIVLVDASNNVILSGSALPIGFGVTPAGAQFHFLNSTSATTILAECDGAQNTINPIAYTSAAS